MLAFLIDFVVRVLVNDFIFAFVHRRCNNLIIRPRVAYIRYELGYVYGIIVYTYIYSYICHDSYNIYLNIYIKIYTYIYVSLTSSLIMRTCGSPLPTAVSYRPAHHDVTRLEHRGIQLMSTRRRSMVTATDLIGSPH